MTWRPACWSGGVGRTAEPALGRLVGDVDAFLHDSFMQTWALRRGDDPLTDLFRRSHIDRLLASGKLRFGRDEIRLARHDVVGVLDPSSFTRTIVVDGREVDVPDPERIQELFDEGATVVLHGLERHVPSVGRFCRQLDLLLAQAAQANAYWTPKSAQGLQVHHDTHDVFIVLLEGEKRFECFTPVVPDAVPGMEWHSGDEPPEGTVELEAVLTPGDVLYLPRARRTGPGPTRRPRSTSRSGSPAPPASRSWRAWSHASSRSTSSARGSRQASSPIPRPRPVRRDELVEVAVAWLREHGTDAIARLAVEGFVTSRSPGYAACGTFACNLASYNVTDELVVKLRDGLCALLDAPPDPPALRWSDRVWPLGADQAAAVAALVDRPDGAPVGWLASWLDGPGRRRARAGTCCVRGSSSPCRDGDRA